VNELQSQKEIEAVMTQYAPYLSMGAVTELAQMISGPIGVKQLLMVLEMAHADSMEDGNEDTISPLSFAECLRTVGN
jgi:hypothetical protein